MTFSMIEKILPQEAEIVLRHTSSYPVKVGELAAELGLIVSRAPLPPKISGLIQPSTSAPAGYEIKVNKYETPERQRFTVAHEIAHYLLHRNDIGTGVFDSIMYRSSLTSRKETEANRLAADIAMPANAVAVELKKQGGVRSEETAETLADTFRVSLPAMKVRLGIA